MAGGILALDLGLTSGFAVGMPGSTPVFRCFKLPGPERGNGARFGALTNKMSDLITEYAPGLIIKEAPLRLPGMTSALTARLHYGYHAIAEEEAWRRDVPIIEAEADQVRKAMLGRSRWPKGVDVKGQVIDWVRRRGFACSQGDQADAIVLWLWACEVHGPVMAKPQRQWPAGMRVPA